MSSLINSNEDVSDPSIRRMAYKRAAALRGKDWTSRNSYAVAKEKYSEFLAGLGPLPGRSSITNLRRPESARRRIEAARSGVSFHPIELLVAALLYEDVDELALFYKECLKTLATEQAGEKKPTFESITRALQDPATRAKGAILKTADRLRVSTEVLHYAANRANLPIFALKPLDVNAVEHVLHLLKKGVHYPQVILETGLSDGNVRAIRFVYQDHLANADTDAAFTLIKDLVESGMCKTRRQLYKHSNAADRAMRLVRRSAVERIDALLPSETMPRWTSLTSTSRSATAEAEMLEQLAGLTKSLPRLDNRPRTTVRYLSILLGKSAFTLSSMMKRSSRVSSVVKSMLETPAQASARRAQALESTSTFAP